MKQIILNNSIEAIQNALRENGARKVMLICGASFRRQRIYNDIIMKIGVPVIEFSDFKPNPKYESVVAAVKLFRNETCDFIIAAGGGSAMDVAKCVKLYSNMNPARNFLTEPIIENSVPILAIPTTAGTGSESTKFAAIYYKEEKQSVAHESCVPRYIIFEPDALISLPPSHKSAAALDALCQAIESYWSVNSTDESKNYARRSIELIMENLWDYLRNIPEANAKMLLAANLAGKAINISQTTAAHAMCYKITTMYGVAHGCAAAICLPEVWRYMARNNREPGLNEVFLEIAAMLGCSSVASAISKIEDIVKKIGVIIPKLENNDLDRLVDSAHPSRLANSPVKIDREGLREIYVNIFS